MDGKDSSKIAQNLKIVKAEIRKWSKEEGMSEGMCTNLYFRRLR